MLQTKTRHTVVERCIVTSVQGAIHQSGTAEARHTVAQLNSKCWEVQSTAAYQASERLSTVPLHSADVVSEQGSADKQATLNQDQQELLCEYTRYTSASQSHTINKHQSTLYIKIHSCQERGEIQAAQICLLCCVHQDGSRVAHVGLLLL